MVYPRSHTKRWPIKFAGGALPALGALLRCPAPDSQHTAVVASLERLGQEREAMVT